MGNLLGKKEPKSRITEQDRAVLGLKKQRDDLIKYKRQKEKNLEKERQTVKELLKQDKKDKARLLLKKKRCIENLIAKTDGQLDSIQQMIDTLEFAQMEIEVVQKLKMGNESLKQLNALFSVEDVEKIMDETREAVEFQAEIDALLAGAGGITDEDEEAIQAELDSLVTSESPALPDVPTHEEALELPEVPSTDPGDRMRISSTKKEAVLSS